MKLNFDAMREIMFVIEEQPSNIDVNVVVFDARLERFDKNELGYAIEKLIESNLLNGQVGKSKTGTQLLIHSISLEGHQFIDAIRQDTVWNKTKETASKVGAATIREIGSIVFGSVKELF
ncbi:DUF2513 domain-containing protein [Lysinibacillus sp. NPDC093692]|uniref:DUF2513 domain-containing protein n=1 Tax=Lysinibacillus sp. NPDC093692 TaxID=3390578 RepID=UPI003CFC8B4B